MVFVQGYLILHKALLLIYIDQVTPQMFKFKKIKIPSLTPDAFGKKTNPVCNPKNIYVT